MCTRVPLSAGNLPDLLKLLHKTLGPGQSIDVNRWLQALHIIGISVPIPDTSSRHTPRQCPYEVTEGRGAGESGRFRAGENGEIVSFSLGGAVYWKMAKARD